MGKFYLFLVAASLGYCSTTAQTKDTLKEVWIRQSAIRHFFTRIKDFNPGGTTYNLDSQALKRYSGNSLSELIRDQTPVFIRSYGFNSLEAANIRGASAAQTAVLWNGIPINDAATGIADLSNLQTSSVDQVSIVYGSSAALTGSGNVGGAIVINNNSPFSSPYSSNLNFSLHAGSYNLLGGTIKFDTTGEYFHLGASGWVQNADNNFEYTTLNGTTQKLQNAASKFFGGSIHLAYKPNASTTIGIMGWGQFAERYIPPALFEQQSDKVQTTGALRSLFYINRTLKNKGVARAKCSFINNNYNYAEAYSGINTSNNNQQVFTELELEKPIGSHGNLLLFLPTTLSYYHDYGENKLYSQSKVAIGGAYKLSALKNRFMLGLQMRFEQTDGFSYGLPGTSIAYKLTRWMTLKSGIQKTYRLPTLFELYTFPGGNTLLKPESGWNYDLGAHVIIKYGRATFETEIAGFNRRINNWILWLGGAIWTPHNLAEVWSRGVETFNKYNFKINERWTFNFYLNTSYVLATTENSYMSNDGTIGKQIPYSPRYNGQAGIGINYKQLNFNYSQGYTGYRFVTADESIFIAPYSTGNLSVMFQKDIRRHPVTLQGSIYNIWNSDYQLVSGRPMPGRNFRCSVNFELLH